MKTFFVLILVLCLANTSSADQQIQFVSMWMLHRMEASSPLIGMATSGWPRFKGDGKATYPKPGTRSLCPFFTRWQITRIRF